MREDEYRSENNTRDTLKRFGRWLTTRPVESWGFFVAGVLIARILF